MKRNIILIVHGFNTSSFASMHRYESIEQAIAAFLKTFWHASADEIHLEYDTDDGSQMEGDDRCLVYTLPYKGRIWYFRIYVLSEE